MIVHPSAKKKVGVPVVAVAVVAVVVMVVLLQVVMVVLQVVLLVLLQVGGCGDGGVDHIIGDDGDAVPLPPADGGGEGISTASCPPIATR